MSVDVAVAGPAAGLRALLRSGGTDNVPRIRQLLGEITDPVELEAAGALLRGRHSRALLGEAAGLAATRVALLGSSTLDPVPNLLTAAALRRGLRPQVQPAGFNRWQLAVRSADPDLVGLQPRLVACLLDDGAVFAGVSDPVDVGEVAERCAAFPAELADWADACREAVGGLTVLATVPLSPLRRHSVVSYAARAELEAAWLRMNAGIADLAKKPSTVVLAASDLSATAGSTFASDRLRHAAGYAYSLGYLAAYAEELARVAAADLGRVGKCLVLDLDGTLWGGVVGDDGAEGIRLGGGYPGSAHAELQGLARDLSAQGVILAISSKNEERIAADAIAHHPEMRLRPESFAAARINWAPKADNVRAIAEELNIGLDALVFVDDNPVERDAMRALAPAVATVRLPAEPAGYAAHLAARGDFGTLASTAEDRGRTVMYRSEARRKEFGRATATLEEYLAGLDSRLSVEPLSPVTADRIVQLFAKTNQFNLTGVRYGADEVGRAGGPAFFGARLADRFGDNGLIAALALGRAPDGAWSIDNFVLSCRVFDRAVEDALVGLVLRAARDQGAPAVLGGYRPTTKNARFADFYPRLGFDRVHPPDQDPAARYRHRLDKPADLPVWLEITTDREVFRVP
ncbi:MAG TPA: HAD-IIIC family phosphatase [Actinocrinis sp.]|nr:HAD-IIIC family phosphatase [Actinocrinis sp.]